MPRNRYRELVGERYQPGGRRSAPGALGLLQRFLNSEIHDFGIDRLGTAADARRWLWSNGLIGRNERVGEREAADLRRLRRGLRALSAANHGDATDPSSLEALRRAAWSATLRVAVDDVGSSTLAPTRGGAVGAAATLLAVVHEAQLDGTWHRVKACRECTYVFYDRSKNRSAAWCSMTICGNRIKNRAYRARRSAHA